MVIILFPKIRAVSEEVPSKIIDCNMVAELAANEDEYYAGIFAVTIYLRGLMDAAKNGFNISTIFINSIPGVQIFPATEAPSSWHHSFGEFS